MNFLDITGLSKFLEKLKTIFAGKDHTHDTYASKGDMQTTAGNTLQSAKDYTDALETDIIAGTVVAAKATQATQDASGNVITATYETKSDATTKYDELNDAIDGKADEGHVHSIGNVTNLQSSLDAKVPTTRTINKKPLSADVTLSASDVGAATTANVTSEVSTHNTSTSAHNDIRNLITALTTKVNNFLDVDDTTTDQLSEVLALIDANKGTLESLTTAKINVSDIVNNLTTNSTGKVLSATQGVAIKALIDTLDQELDTHTHTKSEITDFPTALKNPNLLTIQGNGTTLTNGAYDGSEAKTVNITPAAIGAAPSSHNQSAATITSGTLSADRLPTIPLTKGGTGATSASAARTNLEVYGKSEVYTKSEIDNLELITLSDIDTICGTTYQIATASEVRF